MQTKTITLTSRKDILSVLKNKKIKISTLSNELIPKIELTEGVKYDIGIIRVKDILPEGKSLMTTKEIRAEAAKRGWVTPPAEVGPLLSAELSDEDIEGMGLWYVVTAHEPIEDSDRDPGVLYSDRDGDGRCLGASYGRPDSGWGGGGGFGFVVPQGTETLDTQPSSDPESLELRISELEATVNKLTAVIKI